MMKPQPARLGARKARGVLAPAAVIALTSSLLAPASGSQSEPPIELDSVPANSGQSQQITLITGDVVHWEELPDGQHSVLVEDDGDDSIFETVSSGDDYYVIPSEVAPLVGKTLDRELFNVASLVEQGYTDDAVGGTPVIITNTSDSANRRTASAAPGLAVEQSLPSINGVAGTISQDEAPAFGDALASAATNSLSSTVSSERGTFSATPLTGVNKIWLDAEVNVTLEDSVPQTGAPEAWAAGFDGTGTTIAILDTGIDANHPDVADHIVAFQDFSGKGNVIDGHGHGTHVAATAAGTGDASDGLRKGVAPGADLVIGKVMDDEGSGSTSAIIAGMEWAAAQDDVDVINMSLGGSPSDGTDPMSQALNQLTEEHGVLFVVAAGNDGPGRETVSYPSTADAALSVGAVDNEGQLASFSSRGPRPGDHGIKPEITAPGVGIKAARAAGTAMGDAIDDNYTMSNGTSMATPHVAGAAAIIHEQHPDWAPETVKAALINSANQNSVNTIYQQGGGELDLAGAIQTSVMSTPATLNFGLLEFPHEGAEPITKTLTYTNHSDAASSLDLQAELTDNAGEAAPAGMITVEPTTLDLAPGASAEVSVTVDRSLGGLGTYTGDIAMRNADGQRVAGTPVGFTKDTDLMYLTIDGIQRDGTPADGLSKISVLDAKTLSDFGDSSIDYQNGTATVRVPPGTYTVMTSIYTGDSRTWEFTGQSLMGDPEVEITEDTHLTFDAREATEITVDTPYDDVTVESQQIQYNRQSSESGFFTQGWVGGDWPLSASPTEELALGGEFNFGTKFNLAAPGVMMNLAYPEMGTIPEDLAYAVNEETTATVETAYHSDVPDLRSMRASAAKLPWESEAFTEYLYFNGPLQRTEIYAANETRYHQTVGIDASSGPTLSELDTVYEPGQHLTESWFASPNAPALREGNEHTEGDLPTRTDNTMDLSIFEWGDANSGDEVHFGFRKSSVDIVNDDSFRMYQDGEFYAYSKRGFGTVPVAEGKHRFRLELDTARDVDYWTTSTQTKTAWEFDSDTTEESEALPLLQVHYDIDLDLSNTAKHPRDTRGPFTIGLDVRQPHGVDSPEVEDVKAWLSYDNGQTWEERKVKATSSGTFEFKGDRRDGGGHVSMKVQARDADNNTIEQEVLSAYKLRP